MDLQYVPQPLDRVGELCWLDGSGHHCHKGLLPVFGISSFLIERWQRRERELGTGKPKILNGFKTAERQKWRLEVSFTKIPRSENISIKNWLQKRLPLRHPPFQDGFENSDAAAGQSNSHHHAPTDIWWSSLPLWVGHHVRTNLRFSKWIVDCCVWDMLICNDKWEKTKKETHTIFITLEIHFHL